MTTSNSSGEGSVRFSLGELVRLEEQRVDEQRAAELRRRQAEEAARASAEREQREDADRRELAERAAIEAARHEVDVRAAAEERERRRRHEVELARIAPVAPPLPQADPRPVRSSGAVAAATSVLLAMGLVTYFGVLAPKARADQARASYEMTSKDHVLGELRARLRESDQTIASLRADLARSEARVAMLEAPPSTPAVHAGPTAPTGGHTLHKVKPPLLDCPPGSKDPLCGNLDP